MRFLLLVCYLLQLCSEQLPAVPVTAQFYALETKEADVKMNIVNGDDQVVVARTCGDQKKRVAYKFADGFHSLCLDKKDILLAEINACETLLRACVDEEDRRAVEKEIAELKMALDLMP
ncbi:MAG TPA: hypothetical protein VNI77_07895 [Nitrososphaera sp.]|nr:hypothetical protein [Nitrososphaera sp.]